jgi:hypothetical protein
LLFYTDNSDNQNNPEKYEIITVNPSPKGLIIISGRKTLRSQEIIVERNNFTEVRLDK